MSRRLLPKFYSPLCKKVRARDGEKCRSCKLRNNLSVHHIIYRSQQGPDESWNLITLCVQCHDALHAKNLRMEQDGEGAIDADHEVKFFRQNGWRPR